MSYNTSFKFFKPLVCLIFVLLTALPAISAARADLPDTAHTGVSPDDPLAAARISQQIAAHERDEGRYSTSLYRPLRHLGLVQMLNGNHEAALDAFSRMQHLVHRHHGVYAVEQLESLGYSIDALTRMGKSLDVERRQRFRLRTAERGYPTGHPRLISTKLRVADWYRNTSRFSEADTLYSDVVDHQQPDDREIMVRTYRSLSLNSYLSGKCCADEHLLAASNVMQHQDFDIVERRDASQDYRDLARLLSNEDESGSNGSPQPEPLARPKYLGFSNARDFFAIETPRHTTVLSLNNEANSHLSPVGAPITMCGATLKELTGRRNNFDLNVSLNVSASGRPTDINIEGDAPAKLKRYLKKSLRASKYRPATDSDGRYTDSRLSFKQTFEQNGLAVSSTSPVSDWHHLMVAQACQRGSGLQI